MGDVSGKTIVITGGSSGIGEAAARSLAKMGAQVVITGRSSSTSQVASEIGADPYLVDYASFADVRKFADYLLGKYPRIDVLANNVGGVIGTRRVTEDGHEMTLQVNHLSGFLLTNLLMPRLIESKGIVINTSSGAHWMGHTNFDDLESARRYGAWSAYGTAKLMNILHAMEISRRFPNVRAASFHPGIVTTGFAREGGGITRWLYGSALGRLIMIPPEKGADTLVWLATGQPGTDWKAGEYYSNRKPASRKGEATCENARRLWEESERLTRG